MADESVASGGIAAGSPAPSASPASTPDSSSGSAAPAAQGTPNAGITDSTEREGFIPRARFDEVNARREAAEKWKEQYGWAESVPREQLEQMAQWYGRYQGDPGEFLEYAYNEALSHPVHGATVKSRIGKMLASLRAQQATPEKIEPGIPVMNDQGQIVGRTYTDGQIEQLLQQKLETALSPFKEDLDTRKTQAQKAQERAHWESLADADIAYVKKRPFFAEHKAEILETFKANPSMSLREAADHVLDTKVLPSYGQKAEAKVLSDLQQKANAQTVNPGTPSGSARPKFKSFEEAHAYYEQHPEEAAAMAQR